jgi:hypothetical protein
MGDLASAIFRATILRAPFRSDPAARHSFQGTAGDLRARPFTITPE